MGKFISLILFNFFYLVQVRAYCQEIDIKSSTCSNLISNISQLWKSDSLGINGYRLKVYKQILACKGGLDEELILINLGTPYKVQNTNKGTMFTYIVFDATKLSNPSYEIGTIYFLLGNDKKIIDKGESVLDAW